MLANCFTFAPRDSVPGIIAKICKYLKAHPGWSIEELKEVIGAIETSLAIGEVSYFTNQSINDLNILELYDVGYRFVFIGGQDVYGVMYALEKSGDNVVANGVSLGVTAIEFNQLKSVVTNLSNAAYTAQNPPPYPVTKVNGRTGDVFTLRVDPNDPGMPTDPPVPINATTLNGKKASEYALEYTLALIHDRIYPGVDLTVKFADEIANYSDEWAWITARIKAGNFSGIHVSDYIPVTTSRADGFTFKAQIAGIDTYYNYGDIAVGHHIDFISKELWPDTMVMNRVAYNNGISDNQFPWLVSNAYAYLNSLSMAVPNQPTFDPELVDVDYTTDGILYYLPDKLKNRIVQKRALLGKRYMAASLLTDTNAWGWADIGMLWIPSETEVCGHDCWATNPYEKGGFMQYPIFANNMSRVKFRNEERWFWWLLSPCAGDSGNFVNIRNGGNCGYPKAYDTSNSAPVCFRIS